MLRFQTKKNIFALKRWVYGNNCFNFPIVIFCLDPVFASILGNIGALQNETVSKIGIFRRIFAHYNCIILFYGTSFCYKSWTRWICMWFGQNGRRISYLIFYLIPNVCWCGGSILDTSKKNSNSSWNKLKFYCNSNNFSGIAGAISFLFLIPSKKITSLVYH